jgi:hypothetical protein
MPFCISELSFPDALLEIQTELEEYMYPLDVGMLEVELQILVRRVRGVEIEKMLMCLS